MFLRNKDEEAITDVIENKNTNESEEAEMESHTSENLNKVFTNEKVILNI